MERHIDRDGETVLAALCGGIAAIAGLTAALGVFVRGSGAFETVTSTRGETYDMATTGVYAYNAQRVVAEGIGWDVFTLAVAVPALLIAVPAIARSSFRGRLVGAGLLGYLLYQYLEYSVTWAFGPLFPLFVGIYGLSLIGLVGLGASLARSGLEGRFDDGFPRRSWAVLGLAMSSLLIIMWSGRIAAGLTGGVEGLLLGETTMTVQALDLGLVVPTIILSVAWAWRRSHVGYAFAAVMVVTFAAMAGAIACMLLSAWAVEGALEVVPIGIFGVAAVSAVLIGGRMYRGVEGGLRAVRSARAGPLGLGDEPVA